MRRGFMFKALPTVFAMLLSGSLVVSTHAMEIQKFDKMSDKDQDEYVAELIIGAQRVLREEGKEDLAEQVHKLFTTEDPQGEASTGMLQFDLLLDRARVADLERLKKDPKAPRLEVEHAIILTLKKNGIELPKTFMAVGNNFKPKHSPRDEKK